MAKIVAVLESMWDWRQMTSRAGYKEAPRSFRINPQNYSGKRLYRIVGDADLHVTEACRELVASANHHGTPDPLWLKENLQLLMPFDVLLVCGKVAQATYARSCFRFPNTVLMPHPAARMWTNAMIEEMAEKVKELAYG
jgi:hypothetical protein